MLSISDENGTESEAAQPNEKCPIFYFQVKITSHISLNDDE